MLEQDLERIGAFFFLSLLDEPAAIQACKQAATKYQNRLSQLGEKSNISELVFACENTFKKFGKVKNHGTLSSLSDAFSWPEQVDPSPWREFYRQVPAEHRNAIIWYIILGLPIEDISNGLGISAGTIRYRCGQSIGILGKLTRPSIRSLS